MTAKGWKKRQTEEASQALTTMLSGTNCTPMERDFFIRGYIYGLGARKEPPKPLLCALCGQKAQ